MPIYYTSLAATGAGAAVFNFGQTATHQGGLWLNLLHISSEEWGLCTQFENVDETPSQAEPDGTRPEVVSISCRNALNWDLFINYMNYVDDVAICMFTRVLGALRHGTLRSRGAGLDLWRGPLALIASAGARNAHLLKIVSSNGLGSRQEHYFDAMVCVIVSDGGGA